MSIYIITRKHALKNSILVSRAMFVNYSTICVESSTQLFVFLLTIQRNAHRN